MKQGSQDWLRVRGGKITGSRFARAMAKKSSNAYSNLVDQLVEERRVGKSLDSDFLNDAMRWGMKHEPVARSWYARRVQRTVQEIAFVPHTEIEHVGVSPDGLVGQDGLIEIKCPQRPGFDQVLATGNMPPRYRWQVQGGLWVCERGWADFICFYPPGEGVIQRIDADQNAFDQLEDRCKEILRIVERRLSTEVLPKRSGSSAPPAGMPRDTTAHTHPSQTRRGASAQMSRAERREAGEQSYLPGVANKQGNTHGDVLGWRVPIWVWLIIIAGLIKAVSMMLR